jgi:hypothetical protein
LQKSSCFARISQWFLPDRKILGGLCCPKSFKLFFQLPGKCLSYNVELS